MVGDQVTDKTELEPNRVYTVTEEEKTPAGQVYLTAVGESAAYGVDYETGERVVLRPVEEYLDAQALHKEELPHQ